MQHIIFTAQLAYPLFTTSSSVQCSGLVVSASLRPLHTFCLVLATPPLPYGAANLAERIDLRTLPGMSFGMSLELKCSRHSHRGLRYLRLRSFGRTVSSQTAKHSRCTRSQELAKCKSCSRTSWNDGIERKCWRNIRARNHVAWPSGATCTQQATRSGAPDGGSARPLLQPFAPLALQHVSSK